MSIAEEKRVHKVWQELADAKGKDPSFNIPSIIGKYQYIYSNGTASISLVELPDYFHDGNDLWEIYQVKGNNMLFEDVERFDSKDEAKKKCEEYLSNNINAQEVTEK